MRTIKGEPVPTIAFKDEESYTIHFSDGSFEESPVTNLVGLRDTARAYGLVLEIAPDGWKFRQPKRRATLTPPAKGKAR